MSGLLDNLAIVRSRIAQAAEKAGRDPENIELLAATKSASIEQIRLLAQSGVRHFGENRVQAAQEKIPLARSGWESSSLQRPQWHMIGPLQSNKAKKAAALFDWVDSLDSLKLAETLERECAAADKSLRVLVEVQPVPDPDRPGLGPQDLAEFLVRLRTFKRLDVRGLMGVAPDEETAEAARPHFRLLKRLFDAHFKSSTEPYRLSLGMSRDFEVAIEEGATLVRVGRLLFSETS